MEERKHLKGKTLTERKAYRQAKAERAARQKAELAARRAAVREEARRREAARVAALSPEARAAEEAEQVARKEAYRLSHTLVHPPAQKCGGCRCDLPSGGFTSGVSGGAILCADCAQP